MFEAGPRGVGLTEVARELHQPHKLRMFLAETLQDGEPIVAGAVVDEDDLRRERADHVDDFGRSVASVASSSRALK